MSTTSVEIESGVEIQFALISHTNNGKTTLVRTLTGIDVGEVRDAAHVTLSAESHPLLTTPQGDTLQLWDTPGFGDSVRLFKRLGMDGNPIGWFLREVLDRYRDRPFWLSQQALRTARDAADVVLYLVNSSESPVDAGYLASEMKILDWLGKPVVVLLNQVGAPRPAPQESMEQALWQQHLAQYGVVRDVLALDAFARCWVHERVFYRALTALIDPIKQAGYARLVAVWDANNAERFQAAMRLTSQQVAAAACDSEMIVSEQKKLFKSALRVVGLDRAGAAQQGDKAMAMLVARLKVSVEQATVGLLALHKLDTSEVAKINARVRDNFLVRAPIDKAQAGLLGAIVSGAATGLSADLMAGGLTFGAGAMLGSAVGALTFAGAAWGFNAKTDRNKPSVQFSVEFLRTLLVTGILRYLAVAHFGRGRGNFTESEAPAFWQKEVEQAIALFDSDLSALWQSLRKDDADSSAMAKLESIVTQIASHTLEQLYPAAEK